jgi:hypothetical protein
VWRSGCTVTCLLKPAPRKLNGKRIAMRRRHHSKPAPRLGPTRPIHIGPEPCVGVRKDADQATVGEGIGQQLSRESQYPGCGASGFACRLLRMTRLQRSRSVPSSQHYSRRAISRAATRNSISAGRGQFRARSAATRRIWSRSSRMSCWHMAPPPWVHWCRTRELSRSCSR